jgi:hypothetical protein
VPHVPPTETPTDDSDESTNPESEAAAAIRKRRQRAVIIGLVAGAAGVVALLSVVAVVEWNTQPSRKAAGARAASAQARSLNGDAGKQESRVGTSGPSEAVAAVAAQNSRRERPQKDAAKPRGTIPAASDLAAITPGPAVPTDPSQRRGAATMFEPLSPATLPAVRPTVPEAVEKEFQNARDLFAGGDYADAREKFLDVVKMLRAGELNETSSDLVSLASQFAAVSLEALTKVYTSADRDVTPPVLLARFLPERQMLGSEDPRRGSLDVLVNHRGVVESVHLRSPDLRYRDRWWLSVAKNWEFQPAQKDGHTVKYLLRMPLADAPESRPQ